MKRVWEMLATGCIALIFAAGASRALAQELVINEFMAANDSTLTNAQGETHDWIEIYNISSNTIDLDGWHLTDNDGNAGDDRQLAMQGKIEDRYRQSVIALLTLWGAPVFALAIAALLVGQLWAMTVLLRDPEGRAPWYNGTGVLMYVSGMMVAAFALRMVEGGA